MRTSSKVLLGGAAVLGLAALYFYAQKNPQSAAGETLSGMGFTGNAGNVGGTTIPNLPLPYWKEFVWGESMAFDWLFPKVPIIDSGPKILPFAQKLPVSDAGILLPAAAIAATGGKNPAGTLLPAAVSVATGQGQYNFSTNVYTAPSGAKVSVAPANVSKVAAQLAPVAVASAGTKINVASSAGNLLTNSIKIATGGR